MVDHEKKMTPMMEQWYECKKRAKEALLLFRMGDFYEAFYEDAELLAKELELTLTKRQEIPMSGVPWHTVENYIDRLVNKGYRVAIAEQTEDPRQAKGLVRREIVRYITPGTLMNSSLLGEKRNNYIGAVTQVGSLFGLAICDLTTATFRVVEIEDRQELLNEIFRLNLSELVISRKFQEKYEDLLHTYESISLFVLEAWHFEHQTACQALTAHFQVSHLDGFGLKGMVAAINAAGALLTYMGEELSLSLSHLKEVKPYSLTQSLLLDRTCQTNLGLIEATQKNQTTMTLLHMMDQTVTPMGGRLIRDWLKKPLLDVQEIHKRQESTAFFLDHPTLSQALATLLKGVRDLERLAIKIGSGYANPRELSIFSSSLEKVTPIKKTLEKIDLPLIAWCQKRMDGLPDLFEELKEALVDEPPIRLSEGEIFRTGFHPPLDELRALMQGGKEWLARYQLELKEQLGIKNLKVHYNKIFGYYIEVSKGQAHLIPPSFDRRQTLVNSERFVSSELKEYESKVLTAEERALTLEQELFHALRIKIGLHQEKIIETSQAIAHIDALLSFATLAHRNGYCRPFIDESLRLHILEGRHPVVELCGNKETFIPNDVDLDGDGEKMMLITGPNMAGKSTYIRQVALIVLMAQMGSYVPAKSAHIGIVDRIFTRIGANDDLSRGQSTFMVEMSETANILNNLTPRSLVILDEIGRGTSTYDGLSIAWSVAEHLLKTKAKTLFATHYWELTELEEQIEGVANYRAAIKEWEDEIIFLHKIIKGGADRSYGIHVARLAGLPSIVIQRANAILKKLEGRDKSQKIIKKGILDNQLSLF